jgi:hypothetical protein
MHNFGRGMWRRVGDYQKQQQQQEQHTNRLMQYIQRLSLPGLVQLQKQQAIDAYYGVKKTISEAESEAESVKKEPEPEAKEVTIVEIINDPELEQAVEQEVEQLELEPVNVMNDITVVDFISEATISDLEPEAVTSEAKSVPEETTTSKKKRKKNSGKI